jgi:signal peptidase I
MRQFLMSVYEVVEVALVAIGAVFLIRTFLIQPFLVSGASMVPNFENGDYLLVDELSYYFRAPERGEVVVFRYPKDESTFFIKRIIGLPGEKIHIADGKVTVFNEQNPNGMALDESYLPTDTVTATRPGAPTDFELNPGEYLVLGDNRSYSFDSRDWGVLNAREVVGLVRMRLWPVKEFTVFAAPQYQ